MKAETVEMTVLKPEKRSPEVVEFEEQLRGRIIGQDEAVEQLVNVYQMIRAGMMTAGRPLANLLFLGPTGSGKTRLVEAAAEIFFGDPKAFVKIDCAEYQHSHEIAKLIGSPPGYIGHRETQPKLTQAEVDRFRTDAFPFTFVLFDEIEKADEALWQLLLGILDKARVTLGDNRTTDFSKTIVIMTSNLGSTEMSKLASGSIGFAPAKSVTAIGDMDRKVYRVAVDAAKRRFSPEFMNRIDKVVVFHTLKSEELRRILDIELSYVQDRIFASPQGPHFVFNCSGAAKNFLLAQGTDPKYGARHLKRAIERHLVFPLSNLMATQQIESEEVVEIDLAPDGEHLMFSKQERPRTEGGGQTSAPDADVIPVPHASRMSMWRMAGH